MPKFFSAFETLSCNVKSEIAVCFFLGTVWDTWSLLFSTVSHWPQNVADLPKKEVTDDWVVLTLLWLMWVLLFAWLLTACVPMLLTSNGLWQVLDKAFVESPSVRRTEQKGLMLVSNFAVRGKKRLRFIKNQEVH